MNSIQKNSKGQQSGNYKPKEDKSLTFLTLAVLGLFIGLLLTIGFYSVTIISLFTLSKFIIGFAIIGFIIPLKYYQKWFQFIKYEMIIFNIIGVAPLFTGLFLLLNFTFTMSTTVEEYKIEKLYFDSGRFIGVVLEKNAHANESRIVEFTDKTAIEIKRYRALKLTIDEGLFGFEVVKDRELVY